MSTLEAVAARGVLSAELTSGHSWALVAIAVLFAVSILLAIAETALNRISVPRAQAMVEEGKPGAERVLRLVSNPESFLNVVLLVVLVCQLVQATLVGIVSDALFGAAGVAVATVVNVAVVFVAAEAGPKTWAIQHTERAALLVAPAVSMLVGLPPLQLLSRALIGLTNVLLPGKGIKGGPFHVSEEELLAYAVAAVEAETIEAGEHELIESVIQFGDTIVREVMAPRTDMVTVPSDLRIEDAIEVAILNGYSRIPVTAAGIDDIAGIVYAKDLMRAERDGQENEPVSSVVRPARFVPESKRVAELLPEMQAEMFHMAVVIDEYGGTAGLVTLEDLIEELVGEIVDEFDVEEPMVEPLGGGGVLVNARMPVDEVNDLLGAKLSEGDWDSVGGLIFHLLGHVPVEGEVVHCEGFELRAERVMRRRIGRVRIRPLPSDVAEEATDPAGSVAAGDSP